MSERSGIDVTVGDTSMQTNQQQSEPPCFPPVSDGYRVWQGGTGLTEVRVLLLRTQKWVGVPMSVGRMASLFNSGSSTTV